MLKARANLPIIKWLIHMSITTKFALTILVSMSVISVAGTLFLTNEQERGFNSMLTSTDKIVNDIFNHNSTKARAAQQLKVQNQARLLAAIAPNAIAEFELSALASYAQVVSKDMDVSYVAILNKDGKPLATVGDKGSLPADQFVEAPVMSDDLALGKVIIGYNFDKLNSLLNAEKQQNEKNRNAMQQAKDSSVKTARVLLLISLGVIILTTLGLIFVLFRMVVVRRLQALEHSLRDIAEGEGDLRRRVDAKGNDDIDRVGKYFNLFVEKIHSAIERVNHATLQLAAASQQMSSITDETASAVTAQQSETDQVATAINEMAATVHEVARNASEAAAAAHAADNDATSGKTIVNASVESIHKLASDVENAAGVIAQLKADSESIGTVLDVIQGIAEQTNLLALNAAIEAARAGEQGRGFAVVADEVRTLAQRTQQSTTEIQSMIERVQTGAEKAVTAMEAGRQQTQVSVDKANQAGQSFESITSAIGTINDMNTHIASAAEEQNAVSEEINKNIIKISQLSERTADGARKTAFSSTELSSLSEELSQLMRQFKI